jgi:uncharacterized protein YeaO (DUF488 family)
MAIALAWDRISGRITSGDWPPRIEKECCMIKLKRAYDRASRDDGMRYLVERLWPRGIKKTELPLDGWLKDVAPSPELRKWFSHDPRKWPRFRRRYFTELEAHQGSLEPLLEAASRGPVTLIFSSHDTEHNAAVALRDYLTTHAVR